MDKIGFVFWVFQIFLRKKILVGGVTSALCFGYGVRAAFIQARPMKSGEIPRAQVFSGLGFATRALAIATMITCSGYALFLVGVTTALNVSSPSQFGSRMREMCGTRLRIAGSEKSQKFDEIFTDKN